MVFPWLFCDFSIAFSVFVSSICCRCESSKKGEAEGNPYRFSHVHLPGAVLPCDELGWGSPPLFGLARFALRVSSPPGPAVQRNPTPNSCVASPTSPAGDGSKASSNRSPSQARNMMKYASDLSLLNTCYFGKLALLSCQDSWHWYIVLLISTYRDRERERKRDNVLKSWKNISHWWHLKAIGKEYPTKAIRKNRHQALPPRRYSPTSRCPERRLVGPGKGGHGIQSS